MENAGKELLGKDTHDQITDTVKIRKHSKECLFNVLQQWRISPNHFQIGSANLISSWGQNFRFKCRRNDSCYWGGYNNHNKALFRNSDNLNSNILKTNTTTNTTNKIVISTHIGNTTVLRHEYSSRITGREAVHFLDSIY